jgi:TPP-dependent pyruvate/acetoin dehydrogenase alpha subunit
VLQVPLVISVWDDDYGISVHAKHQTTKENISEILKDSREMTLQKDMKFLELRDGIILN